METIKIAKTAADISSCFEVLKVLRPHLARDGFVENILEMISEGYNLAYIGSGDRAVAAVGFRYINMLYIGKHFYIDDLITLPEERGKGLAGKLLDYVFEEALKRGYKNVTLDSGYLRHEAHRLYLNKGFTINCHHFLKKLE